MPFRQRGFSGRRRTNRLGSIVDSNKNSISLLTGEIAGTNTNEIIALTVDAAANATANEVTRGSHIYRIWLEFWVNTTVDSAIGVTNAFEMYICKNPGANLTLPTPGTVGTSNEKKFVFKEWKGLIGARTDGYPPYYWRGWIKVPKIYQRMGADDTFNLVSLSSGVNAINCRKIVYKWFK